MGHTLRRTIAIFVAAGLLAACGSKGAGSTPAGGAASSGSSAQASGSTSYSYVNNGLEASFTLSGTSGKLEITNGSGKAVGVPAIYSLDPATGDRIDAGVDGAAPIADGTSGSYAVTFPDGFDAVAAGFVGLEFGGKDYGGFVEN
jgi:hypothetical protein